MYIITNSLILTIISALLLFQEGIIVDELALDGDAVTFYIVAFTVIVFFVGLVVYLFKTSKH